LSLLVADDPAALAGLTGSNAAPSFAEHDRTAVFAIDVLPGIVPG
jgi:putative transposase